MSLTKTEKNLLSLLGKALFGVDSDKEVDREILTEAMHQAVLPLIAPATEQSMGIIANNIRVSYEHTELHQLLEGIPYTIIKGAISAAYYPQEMLRTMGDVDFLIHHEDVDKVKKILIQNGFQVINESHPCEIIFLRDKSMWELHWEVNGIPGGKSGELIRNYLADTIETAIEVKTPEGIYKAPDAFHHGLIILLHNSHHMLTTGIGLRHLCDWAVFVHKVNVEKILKKPLQQCGLWRYAQILTQLSVKYLGLTEQVWAMENVDDALLEAIMEDIFKAGNFGKKNTDRYYEATMISDRNRGNIRGNVIIQVMYSINEMVKIYMPEVKEKKYLLPVGWVYVVSKRIGRVLRGERTKIHFRKTLKGASHRREIYKEFHLFE